MFESLLVSVVMPVALLAEGVDRNFAPNRILWKNWSRPPRGGRG